MDATTESAVDHVHRSWFRLRAGTRTLLQVTLAVSLSWLITHTILGYDAPFFAPIASVIVLNSLGGRGRRAIEVVLGVATGILVGDLLILWLGTGGWQLVLVCVLAMAVVIGLGGSPLVITQAAVSAILVATIQPPGIDWIPHRFFHAAIGGAVALVVAQVVLPLDPARHLLRAAQPVFAGLGAVLDRTSMALAETDPAEAEAALVDARALDGQVRELEAVLDIARETARFSPSRRGRRKTVQQYREAARQIDLAVRNTRVLARSALALVAHGPDDDGAHPAPPEVALAVADLADAVRCLGDQLIGDAPAARTHHHAGQAAARTRVLFSDSRALSLSRVVGQIRSTGIDLLRGAGLDTEEAQRTLYDALSRDGMTVPLPTLGDPAPAPAEGIDLTKTGSLPMMRGALRRDPPDPGDPAEAATPATATDQGEDRDDGHRAG